MAGSVKAQSDILELAREARAGLERIYGSRLKSVYLFGSFARGEEGVDSDVDIAVVLDRVDDVLAEIEKTGDLFSILALRIGRVVSRTFLTEKDLQAGRYALSRTVREEGVLV